MNIHQLHMNMQQQREKDKDNSSFSMEELTKLAQMYLTAQAGQPGGIDVAAQDPSTAFLQGGQPQSPMMQQPGQYQPGQITPPMAQQPSPYAPGQITPPQDPGGMPMGQMMQGQQRPPMGMTPQLLQMLMGRMQ